MRSYGHYCAVAKGLDVVGDRWTLLIVRELLLQGGCRYTDLQHGLPGIATNLLSERLKELEENGLIRREAAPPPIATTLYDLTDAGRELEPVLRALGRFGARFMPTPTGDEAFRSLPGVGVPPRRRARGPARRHRGPDRGTARHHRGWRGRDRHPSRLGTLP
jgi:DNA-binding HxlR family transcriptional regulator